MAELTDRIINNIKTKVLDSFGNPQVDPVTVWVAGVAFNPWENISITKSINNVVGGFSMSFSDKWRESNSRWDLTPNKTTNIRIGSDSVLTGFIDSVNPVADATNRTISISGRDKTGDLADCSHIGKFRLQQVTFLQFANELLGLFGIVAEFEDGTVKVNEPFDWTYQQGDKVIDALIKEGKPRGYSFRTNELGNLVIFNRNNSTSKDRSEVDLVQEENILSARARFDYSKRFTQYIVKGQATNNPILNERKANQAKGQATDDQIARWRPLMILSDTEVTAETAQKQAEHEMDLYRRAAITVEVEVEGWRQKPGGALWEPNTIVTLDAKFVGMPSSDMLISSVTYSKSTTGGTKSMLSLVVPDSFRTEKVKKKKEDPLNLLGASDPVDGMGWQLRRSKIKQQIARERRRPV